MEKVNTFHNFGKPTIFVAAGATSPPEARGGGGGKGGEEKSGGGGGNKLMTKEHQQFGGVTGQIYLRYFKSTGGYWFVAFVFFSFAADTTSRTMADWYLSNWSNEDSTDNKHALVTYLGILSISLVFVFIKTLMVAKGM